MVQRPRGTRDFGPAEMAVRNELAAALREVFTRFGFHEVQTPTFEELDLFTQKSGQGIVSELYAFEDKGGRMMTLRPELTAPVMRFYHAEHAFDPKPLKWFYHSNCFRYDRPQAGRYREFWQFGCELIGAGTPLAYAELIALADACLKAAGVPGYRTGVGHVGVLRNAVDALGLDEKARSEAMRLIDKKDRAALDGHMQSHGCPPPAVARLRGLLDAKDVRQARAHSDDPALDELEACLDALDELGAAAVIDLGIARGLDYYTGIVFETHVDELGTQSQVLGGGGYDLSGLFGSQPTPTMGFGLGFDRVVEASGRQAVASGPDVAFGWLSDAARTQVLRWTRRLREAGLRVEVDLIGRKAGKVAEWAGAIHAARLVLVGDRDLERDTVQVKCLDTGEATDVAVAELEESLVASVTA